FSRARLPAANQQPARRQRPLEGRRFAESHEEAGRRLRQFRRARAGREAARHREIKNFFRSTKTQTNLVMKTKSFTKILSASLALLAGATLLHAAPKVGDTAPAVTAKNQDGKT